LPDTVAASLRASSTRKCTVAPLGLRRKFPLCSFPDILGCIADQSRRLVDAFARVAGQPARLNRIAQDWFEMCEAAHTAFLEASTRVIVS
jgi:hypothetical protein